MGLVNSTCSSGRGWGCCAEGEGWGWCLVGQGTIEKGGAGCSGCGIGWTGRWIAVDATVRLNDHEHHEHKLYCKLFV